MNTHLLAAAPSRVLASPSAIIGRLARRAGLALVRWSSERSRGAAPSSADVQVRIARDRLRVEISTDAQQRVLLIRPF